MQKFLGALLLGVGNVVAIAVLKYLEIRKTGPLEAIVISACVGIVVTKIGEYILLELPLRFGLLRRFLDSRAALEGKWLERIPALPGNPYTLLTISYNPESGNYSIYGRNYDIHGNEIRTFDSQHVSISPSLNQIIYTYTAHQSLEEQSDAAGICCMDFRRGNSGNYEGGDGFFFNRDLHATKFAFSFQRISSRNGETDRSIIDRLTSLPAPQIAQSSGEQGAVL